MNPAKPWVQSRSELDSLAIDGEGRVVLTHPGRSENANLSLGQALDWALSGPTRSFNVVVGYFNHQEHEASARPASVPSPSQLVEREIADERGRGPDECVFRLVFGEAQTAPAAHALRSWYWLCRWRHAHPERALAWRSELVSVLEKRLQASPSPRGPELAALAWPLLAVPGAPFFDEVVDATADHAARLLHLDSEGLRVFEAWRREFIERDRSVPILDLILYFTRMSAAVRMDSTPGIALFHPKLYVVERHADVGHPEDAIVVTGSGNWSAGAFGRTLGDRANVEVATIHRIAPLEPNAWSGASENTSKAGLGASLAATAAHLFSVGTSIAAWGDPACVSPQELDDRLRVQGGMVRPPPEPEPPPEPAPDPIAPILRSLIERTLGLGDISSFARYERAFGEHGLWGGKTPSRYQLDGALRLLAILEGAPARMSDVERPAERGAFLTDEPGLGKTLIAQMVVAALASERLRVRHLARSPETPLRISLIAPARIAGREGRGDAGATGWHAAAVEIRQAVRLALMELPSTAREYMTLEPSKLIDALDIRVLSTTSFGRHVESGNGALATRVIDDWFHVARSEIVVVDESHNFRNGQAAATRALRFLLSLPVPGERWPLLLGEPTLDRGAKAIAEIGSEEHDGYVTSRKVLCLSATPFNNRLDDFITQVGHFARYQAWCLPAPAQGEMFGGLRSALATWNTPSTRASVQRATFETLVLSVSRHLGSGRRLDDDEVKAEARERNERSRRRPEDEGPLYDWAPRYDDLRRSFAQVAEWLQGYVAGQSSPEDGICLAALDRAPSAGRLRRSRHPSPN